MASLNLTAKKDEVLRIAQGRMKQYKEAVVSFQATINRTVCNIYRSAEVKLKLNYILLIILYFAASIKDKTQCHDFIALLWLWVP